MDEWALITTKHERFSKIIPWRGTLPAYKEGIDVVSYLSYATDRNTGERVQFTFSHYASKHSAANWVRKWWGFPVHQFGAFTGDVAHDGDKFTKYSICGEGGPEAKAGAFRLEMEDTGYDARKVKSFAGFKDAESALVFFTNTHVSVYQQLDYLVCSCVIYPH